MAGMIARGWQEDPNPTTRKYRVFKAANVSDRAFLGKYGAFRYGRSATSSRSVHPVSQTYLGTLDDGDKALAAKELI